MSEHSRQHGARSRLELQRSPPNDRVRLLRERAGTRFDLRPRRHPGCHLTRAVSERASAVFLSYAPQDAEAARRICCALRAAGVEVWFDQSELSAFAIRLRRDKRGGDAWDTKIRKQIKECALFIPLISSNTNARAEGYFRLEWKLAVDRSHLMADDQPFIVPVVIDETQETAARVPDKFRDVQWTRLVAVETPAAFAERIRVLVGGGPPASRIQLRTSDLDRHVKSLAVDT